MRNVPAKTYCGAWQCVSTKPGVMNLEPKSKTVAEPFEFRRSELSCWPLATAVILPDSSTAIEEFSMSSNLFKPRECARVPLKTN